MEALALLEMARCFFVFLFFFFRRWWPWNRLDSVFFGNGKRYHFFLERKNMVHLICGFWFRLLIEGSETHALQRDFEIWLFGSISCSWVVTTVPNIFRYNLMISHAMDVQSMWLEHFDCYDHARRSNTGHKSLWAKTFFKGPRLGCASLRRSYACLHWRPSNVEGSLTPESWLKWIYVNKGVCRKPMLAIKGGLLLDCSHQNLAIGIRFIHDGIDQTSELQLLWAR